MMITELIDQDDFRALLRAWGATDAVRLPLADCGPFITTQLASGRRLVAGTAGGLAGQAGMPASGGTPSSGRVLEVKTGGEPYAPPSSRSYKNPSHLGRASDSSGTKVVTSITGMATKVINARAGLTVLWIDTCPMRQAM